MSRVFVSSILCVNAVSVQRADNGARDQTQGKGAGKGSNPQTNQRQEQLLQDASRQKLQDAAKRRRHDQWLLGISKQPVAPPSLRL